MRDLGARRKNQVHCFQDRYLIEQGGKICNPNLHAMNPDHGHVKGFRIGQLS